MAQKVYKFRLYPNKRRVMSPLLSGGLPTEQGLLFPVTIA